MKFFPNVYAPVNRGEVNNEPSMTIPDMTYSISEILRLHSIGTLPAGLVRDVLYDESDDFDSVLAEYLPAYDLVDKDRELLLLRKKFEAMRSIKTSPTSHEDSPVSDSDSSSSETTTPVGSE
ncbi:hypothetical protein [Dipodfec virus UA06Rod_19]|uniref:Uncharacterized protein n=1 Tax=Dipodfec virus UA06Rod_19 TaxID=2929319 RepID=A0A976R745_9VIRU|nr:hypothetical protein [Dipodfec virus UA06Rod_19]